MHLRPAAALLAVVALALALAGCGGGGKKAASAPAAADAVVKTSEGTFTIHLDAKDSPNAVTSFEKLAKKGFFKGTIFHRIVPGFVIQGGDPTGTGNGGPGYTTTDPPTTNAKYTHGVVAMAKTATEAPGTAGSQFFVVTAQDAQLPPDYALLGKVVSGLDVVDKIGKLGNPTTEQPTKRVVIESVTIRPS
ncbi:MAG: peptidylprolyl isomerase [Gaiellaceae bacterium]